LFEKFGLSWLNLEQMGFFARIILKILTKRQLDPIGIAHTQSEHIFFTTNRVEPGLTPGLEWLNSKICEKKRLFRMSGHLKKTFFFTNFFGLWLIASGARRLQG